MKGINCALCAVLCTVLIFLASCEPESTTVVHRPNSKLFEQVVGHSGWVRFKITQSPATFEGNTFSRSPSEQTNSGVFGEIVAIDNGWLWLEEAPTKNGIFNKHAVKHLIALDDIASISIE